MRRILPEIVRERRNPSEAAMAPKYETSGELVESDAELAARTQHAIASALGVKPLALSYTQVLDLERL